MKEKCEYLDMKKRSGEKKGYSFYKKDILEVQGVRVNRNGLVLYNWYEGTKLLQGFQSVTRVLIDLK